MTSTEAAQDAVSALLKGNRRQLQQNAPGIWNRVFMNLGIWSKGKAGKTHLALSAESTQIRKPDVMDDFEIKEYGETLIYPRPLRTAYANFDREVESVLGNLDAGFDIVAEDFYRDKDGNLLVPIMMMPADFIALFKRFAEFINDAVSDEMHLVVVDGGTAIWEDVREWKLPRGKQESGEENVGIAPKQYATSNTAMRNEIMVQLRSSQIHTIITREAAAVWKSASETLTDAQGNEVMRPDGWNKTSHFIDMDVQIKLKTSAIGVERVGIPNIALKPAVLGAEILDPTFEELFRRNYAQPLVLHQDVDEYLRAIEEYGSVSTGPVPSD